MNKKALKCTSKTETESGVSINFQITGSDGKVNNNGNDGHASIHNLTKAEADYFIVGKLYELRLIA